MAAQSDLMKGWPHRIALYCLYNIALREICMDKLAHTGRQTDAETAETSISPSLLLTATKICLSVRPGLCKPWSSCSLQGSHIQSAGSQEPPENPAPFKTHVCVLPNMLLNSACFPSELQSDQWCVPPCPAAAPTESKAEAVRRHISSRDDITNSKSCDVISQLSIYCNEILREQVTSLTQ